MAMLQQLSALGIRLRALRRCDVVVHNAPKLQLEVELLDDVRSARLRHSWRGVRVASWGTNTGRSVSALSVILHRGSRSPNGSRNLSILSNRPRSLVSIQQWSRRRCEYCRRSSSDVGWWHRRRRCRQGCAGFSVGVGQIWHVRHFDTFSVALPLGPDRWYGAQLRTRCQRFFFQ